MGNVNLIERRVFLGLYWIYFSLIHQTRDLSVSNSNLNE